MIGLAGAQCSARKESGVTILYIVFVLPIVKLPETAPKGDRHYEARRQHRR
jgi:hypothetical protein